tara:strand:+ start:55 stop:462 length:408 start_codon:yes stop_codon:yes gene_type:complete
MIPKCEVPDCNKIAQNQSGGPNPRRRKSIWIAELYGGEGYICHKHHAIKYGMGGWDYKIHRKEFCENIDGRLGFNCKAEIIDYELQIDVDHIDGNSTNNDPKNLQSLCKNCHAIKTQQSKDYLTPGRKTLKRKAA